MPMTSTVIGCFLPPLAGADEEPSAAAEEEDAAGALAGSAGGCCVSFDGSAMAGD